MKRHASTNAIHHPSGRSGATLTEVLMSLLIMGIGIVPLFTLFPISLLQSIRGSQLTNAALLEENMQAMVKTVPSLASPPSGSPWDGYVFRGEWTPNTDYFIGNVIIPPRQQGEILPRPYVILHCTTAGTSGNVEPVWYTTGASDDGSLQWTAFDRVAAPQYYNYIVDPVGAGLYPAPFNNFFGNDGTTTLGVRRQAQQPLPLPPLAYRIPRLDPSPFVITDTWATVFTTTPVSVVGDTVTLPPDADASGMTDLTLFRVILRSSADNTMLIRYPGAGTNGTTIRLADRDGNYQAVGANMDGPLTFETLENRYSCMLAVRDRGAAIAPLISCVTFYSRSTSLDSEHAYQANFGNTAFTAVANIAGTYLTSTDQVVVAWGAGEPAPLLKEGNYILDADRLLFYRITNVSGTTSPAILTLDRRISTYEQTPTASTTGSRAILMPGIIDVFNF